MSREPRAMNAWKELVMTAGLERLGVVEAEGVKMKETMAFWAP